MTNSRFHILRSDNAVTVARRLPVRLDIKVVAAFPALARARLAQQVRQDLWRALRDVRGFSPVVRVEGASGAPLHVIAGGQLDGQAPMAALQGKIAALLADPKTRARWIAQSRLRSANDGRPRKAIASQEGFGL